MTKEDIKQWLLNDGQVPEGCENNEYWSHWYDVIHRMLQGQSLPIDSVGDCSEIYCMYDRRDAEIFCAFDDKERADLEHEECGAPYQIVKLHHGKRK